MTSLPSKLPNIEPPARSRMANGHQEASIPSSGYKRRRRRQGPPEPTLREKVTGLALLGFSIIYMVLLWTTESLLDKMEAQRSFRIPELMNRGKSALEYAKQNIQAMTTTDFRKIHPSDRRSRSDKFILYQGNMGGQGEGNTMAGLLAAHLLGYEFDRTVCVAPRWKHFHQVFETIHPDAVEGCPRVFEAWNTRPKDFVSLTILSYQSAPNECFLQDLFQSNHTLLALSANTYPRWSQVPDNFFFSYYRAKDILLKTLPYDSPPKLVVHLRDADSVVSDPRRGTNKKSLDALGELLSARNPYLVTNRVEWYDYFEQNFRWRHPEWSEVVHSAFHKAWGVRGEAFVRDRGKLINPKNEFNDTRNSLEMWSDWYTLLTAEEVYHTHSDFSISAVHWQNIKSKVIGDWNETSKQLDLFEESWRESGETPSLVDRRTDVEGSGELRRCEQEKVPIDDPVPADDDPISVQRNK